MNVFAVSSLVSSFLCFFFGIFVYHLDHKKDVNKIFLLTCICISYWSFTEFMVRQAESLETANFWFRSGFLWPLTISFLFHFILIFTEKAKNLRNTFKIPLIYAPALFFSLIELTTDQISSGLIKATWGYTYRITEESLLFWVASIWLVTLGILGLVLCYQHYSEQTEKKKQQTKFVILGLLIPLCILIISEVVSVTTQPIFPDISAISTTTLCIFVGYAIWKYELFVLNQATAAENILSIIPDSIILINLKEKIQSINQSLVQLLGYSENELKGKPVEHLYEDKQVAKNNLETLFTKGSLKNYETDFKTKSDKTVPVSISALVVKDKEEINHGAVFIVHDISERKNMEERLIRSEKLSAIGQAATMVGHDLRNPLQAIENATYCITRELETINPNNYNLKNSLKMLQIIEDSIRYADNIILDLKDFSGERKPEIKKTNMNDIVKEALLQCKTPKNVETITKLESSPVILPVDSYMMKRVFVNIITNSLQSMEKHGGTLEISIKKTKTITEVSFQDTGIGMSKETMEHLFSPFFTTRAQGMGVGLAISKKFVDINGGSIEVESEEGNGSKFTIKLPHNK